MNSQFINFSPGRRPSQSGPANRRQRLRNETIAASRRPAKKSATRGWEELRLKDRIEPGVRILFVGINPGVRSAQTGHHFAGHSNRFWRLLFESGLVPERIDCTVDVKLPEWGLGITNLVARPSRGIDDLRPADYAGGWAALRRKILRYRPGVVALVGVTLYRALLPFLAPVGRPRIRSLRAVTGPQPFTIASARLFVLPNPSGRNANFSYAEMLTLFRQLKRWAAQGTGRGQREKGQGKGHNARDRRDKRIMHLGQRTANQRY